MLVKSLSGRKLKRKDKGLEMVDINNKILNVDKIVMWYV